MDSLCIPPKLHYMALMADAKRLLERSIIAVNGDDAEPFLKGLVTNGPPASGSCFSALLTPQGKVLFDFFITRSADGFWLDVHETAAEALIKRLTLYRLRAKVSIELDDNHVVCVSQGYFRADMNDMRVIAEKEAVSSAENYTVYHADRIAHGIPEWGADFGSEEVFPMDVNYDAIGGMDYQKGCFVGQEVASRMKRKGDARKRTLIAKFDSAPPAKRTPVIAGQSTLGHIMSGIDGGALALIRLDRFQEAEKNAIPIECNGAAVRLLMPGYLQQG